MGECYEGFGVGREEGKRGEGKERDGKREIDEWGWIIGFMGSSRGHE